MRGGETKDCRRALWNASAPYRGKSYGERCATLARLRREQEDRCLWCGRTVVVRFEARPRADTATIDHIVPRALGGSSDPSNLALACAACNAAKGNTHPDEWASLLRRRDTGGRAAC